ncbi:MAG TPA: hypothetical protein VIR33_06290 [Thermopolyspora sp.]|jgi:hypothetical protein
MSESYARVQYLYLVRLAWSLRRIGLNTTVDVPGRDDPAVLVPADTGWLRIIAARQGAGWVYAWGQERDQVVWADAEAAARRIAGLMSR